MIPCVLTDASATTDTTPLSIAAHQGFDFRQATGYIPLDGPWHVGAVTAVFRAVGALPDWDSYGSPSPTLQAREKSLALLTCVVNSGFDCRLPIPYAFPVPGGGLRLEWELNQREVALEVLPNGSMEFFRAQNGRAEEEGPLHKDRIPRILEWLAGSA
jgi:hypothetical protein